ncbi:PAS domain S-box protein [Mucilaginibacter sp. 14171R-50]|uniref:sensor histidine kinase n=1 Tax=Mucilaginibacter sp. 14171R-50 TaxID=2703789 RepID=UPI00138C8896|nr:PAS domain-containing sensor histidine kinase [Mucilaginibacter sp. 14171R-50]QHS54673.1 PAS domain S-box protein [Mucilaginibacter sp. 14171R-50]
MENIYKIILEETLAGYWDCYLQEDKVILSAAFKAMFGYLDHELPDTTETWAKLILPEDMPRMDACLKAHYESHGKNPFNIDVRYKHKNGSIVWINTTGRVIEWDGGTPLRMVGCHIDITDKKTIEQTLEISEETFRNAFEYSPIGVVLVSMAGKFMKVNKSICEMLGYTAEELMTKTFQEITHPEDLEADLALLQKTLSGEIRTYNLEKRYIKKDGSFIWILLFVALVRDKTGEPLYFVSQIKDITERKKAESQLKESERRWIFASEGTGGGIWDFDLRNNTIFHSKQCLSMIGLEEHEFSNEPGQWTKRVHPDDRERYIADVRAYIEGKTDIYSNQHRVLCKDGTYKWILDRGKVIEYDENNKAARIIGTHIDITEQKQQEQHLRETLEVVSSQNNRLLNFAYIVSHNLRTHASNFKMIMDVLADPHTSEEEKTELSGHLAKVSEQLNETITNLNEVVSIQTNVDIQKSEIDLLSYFNRAVALLSNDISLWHIHIDNQMPPDCTLVYSPAYLESIILNLVSNAIKYRSATEHPEITFKYFNEHGRQGFTIADNGIGIDMEKNGNDLFGMYKTFNGNRDAKGMGLFITKNQVEALGGKIEVTSQLGKGTTFKVYLT